MLVTLERFKEDCEALATQVYQALNSLMLDNPLIAMMWSTVAAIIVVIIAVRIIDGRKPKTGFEDMAAKQAELDKIYADKIHEFLFDMLHRGDIDKKQYRRDLERFGQKYRLTDIIRTRKPKAFIRIRVKHNVKMMRLLTMRTKPGVIPGPLSGMDLPTIPLTPVAIQRKVFVVMAKKRG